MLREVVILTMLKDEYTLVFEHVFFKDQIRNVCQLFQGIGWISEDEIELLSATLHKAEHITSDSDAFVSIQFLQALLDKRMMIAVCLHADDLSATS